LAKNPVSGGPRFKKPGWQKSRVSGVRNWVGKKPGFWGKKKARNLQARFHFSFCNQTS